MRARTIVMACSLGVAASVSAVACSADLDAGDGTGMGEAGGAGGDGAGFSHTGSDTTTHNQGGGYGGGYNGTTYTSTSTTGQVPPDDPPPEETDAGADAAAFTCDGLDTTKPVVLYLSADDSNSMGSPVQARELLRKGWAPSWIRTYEFLNYYRIAYPAAPPSELSLFAEAAVGATPAEIDLQLGIRSFDALKPRRAMTITFVLDTSGSMEGEPMERQIAAVKAVAGSLADGDIVNIVTWSTSNKIVLQGHSATGPYDDAVMDAANALTAGGGTDLQGGLVEGYKLAKLHYGEARLNRVILISDGGANVGITDKDLIGNSSQDADKEGIYMVGVGAGTANFYNDALMDTVTDRGRGAYVYLDEPAEADRMFIDRFDETMEIAARGVQVELTLPWYFKIDKFSGEEYSENPEEIEPQHLAPSDAMVLNQVLKACDPAMINPADPVKLRVTWQTPLVYEAKETLFETTVGDLLAADKPHLAKGKAIVGYAEALKTGTNEALHAALTAVEAANTSGTDPELLEIAELIKLHPQY